MRRALVAANWKMHGRRAAIPGYLAALRAGRPDADGVELLLCPPTVYLEAMAAGLDGDLADVSLGAQDCSPEGDDGAYTGEVSARMLAELGCRSAIVGHSERRRRCGEDDALVAAKFRAAQAAGLVPVLCVGETAAERDAGRAHETVLAQLEAVIETAGAASFHAALLAYEPVWAIGSGRAATPDAAQEMHGLLRAAVARHDAEAGESLRILYGGSVKAANAAALFAMPDIDGALVGGASLDPAELLMIVAAAAARSGR